MSKNNQTETANFSPLSFVAMMLLAMVAVASISPTAGRNMQDYFSPGKYNPVDGNQLPPRQCRPLEGGGTVC